MIEGESTVDQFYNAMDRIDQIQFELENLATALEVAGNTKVNQELIHFKNILEHSCENAKYAFAIEIKRHINSIPL